MVFGMFIANNSNNYKDLTSDKILPSAIEHRVANENAITKMIGLMMGCDRFQTIMA